MATTTELYQVSLEFLLQRLGQTDSPIAPEAYRRFRGEVSIGEKRDVILFTKVRQAPLRDYLDQATLQALWHRQTLWPRLSGRLPEISSRELSAWILTMMVGLNSGGG
jgi:hypothetical protein